MCKPDVGPTTTTLTDGAAVSSDTTTSSSTSPKKTSAVATAVITNEKLRSHNSPHNAWCAVHGKVLDISTFAKRHPGGDVILLAAGRDATVLFETYHPRGVPETVVKKLQVGVMEENAFPPSFYSWNSPFYTTLKRRVVARLEQKQLPRRGGYEIWIKAICILTSFWYSLYRLCLAATYVHALLWALSLGTWASFVGTCIQHDGNHGAFAFSGWLNKFAGWTQDMIGASAFTWEVQHMLGHHPYTNVLDVDEDRKKVEGVDCPVGEKDQESDPDVFSSFPLVRMHPIHEPQWYHRYQHIYTSFLFALMTLSKVFKQDVDVAISRRLYHIDATCRYGSLWNIVRFWCMKAITAVYMMGLPCYFHGVGRGLSLFFIAHFWTGELLATMFIVNHVIEGVAFAKKGDDERQCTEEASSANDSGEEKKTDDDADVVRRANNIPRPTTVTGITPMIKTQSDAIQTNAANRQTTHPPVPLNDWAAVQCQTSVNWSSGSWFWNHFSGGLSHQIEHHLFPSLCHTNYVYIQDVVERTCLEFGVPYQSEPNLLIAYWKMLRHLKFMGTEKKEG